MPFKYPNTITRTQIPTDNHRFVSLTFDLYNSDNRLIPLLYEEKAYTRWELARQEKTQTK